MRGGCINIWIEHLLKHFTDKEVHACGYTMFGSWVYMGYICKYSICDTKMHVLYRRKCRHKTYVRQLYTIHHIGSISHVLACVEQLVYINKKKKRNNKTVNISERN